ncbi:MAG: HAD family hydrolase [Woeseiaceae bacterium]|nr:HAD family hydrolase [Woeseiaceae bacterium]
MKAVIFDIDGTLLESMAIDTELYFAAIRDVLGAVEVRPDLHDYEHVTDAGILQQLLEDNGLASRQDLAADFQRTFLQSLRTHVADSRAFPTIDGAIDFFNAMRRAADTRVAIATGCWRESALLKLDSAGFDIDGVPLASCDDSPSRVDIMRTALGRLEGTFDSITYFGDAEWDRRACRTLAWNFVAVGPGLGGITSYADLNL